MRQQQKVTFLNVHETESLWWNVKDEDSGESGYVPGSYLMVIQFSFTYPTFYLQFTQIYLHAFERGVIDFLKKLVQVLCYKQFILENYNHTLPHYIA